MPEQNKNSKKVESAAYGFFALATVCTLPFMVILLTGLIDFALKQTEQTRSLLAAFLIFGWPVLLFPAILGLISIVVAWVSLPKMRLLLAIYAVIIIGFMLWLIRGIESVAGTGP